MRALRDNGGLTLIEVMMAMLVSFIVFLGLSETIVVAVNVNVQNALRDEAVRVAEEEINAVRTIPFDNVVIPSALLPATDNALRTFRNMTMNYDVTRNLVNTGSDMTQVFITVGWKQVNRKTDPRYSITFTTIVRKR